MTLQQCRYAVEIANCGSFNDAAKRLFIAQSSLSASIKELEKELGITIFNRTNKGINISVEGSEFLEYANQMIAQADIIERRYLEKEESYLRFSVSTQHYDFAAEAFAKLIMLNNKANCELKFRETKTYDVIENVRLFKSDIGILYINELNSKMMKKIFNDNDLVFHPLFETKPYIFIGEKHPLSNKKIVKIEDIEKYPYIIFEQDEGNAIQYAEEAFRFTHNTNLIKINDRATMLNLLTETNGFTIGSGVVVSNAQKNAVKAIPIDIDQVYTIGWITHKYRKLSEVAKDYIEILLELIPINSI